MTFAEANKVEHKVEDHWSYPIMINQKWKPIDKIGIGFVRSYRYEKDGRTITCTTGSHSDNWTDKETGASGMWSTLGEYLKS